MLLLLIILLDDGEWCSPIVLTTYEFIHSVAVCASRPETLAARASFDQLNQAMNPERRVHADRAVAHDLASPPVPRSLPDVPHRLPQRCVSSGFRWLTQAPDADTW